MTDEPDIPIPKVSPRTRAGQYVWPTATATAISLVGGAAVGGYQMGNRDALLRQEILNEVARVYVTKETSENRGSILSSDIAEIRRAVGDIRESIKGIPRIEAKLEILDEQVRGR